MDVLRLAKNLKVWPLLQNLKADGIILRDVEKVDEALTSGLPAVVVGHHGIFTFGEEARVAYERMIQYVSQAEAYLEQRTRRKAFGTSRVEWTPPQDRTPDGLPPSPRGFRKQPSAPRP